MEGFYLNSPVMSEFYIYQVLRRKGEGERRGERRRRVETRGKTNVVGRK